MSNSLLPLYIAVFIFTFVITALLEKALIPRLRRTARQPIYDTGPAWHRSKDGTPTMGGVAFLISIIAVLCLCCIYLTANERKSDAWLLLCSVVYAMLNGAVGVLDDVRKIRGMKNDKGLKPTEKLIMQLLLSSGLVLTIALTLGVDTTFKFLGANIELGAIYYPLAVVVLVGITNCANLTDGIDGLASSVAFAIGIALFYTSFVLYPASALIGCGLMGGCCGFLIFNLHPAKIFMGDTGSLFLGSIVASTVLLLGNPILILLIGSVYVIEGLSVIMQVIYFKATRKRLFRMAPLHHHLEKCGWSENKICIVAIIVTLGTSIFALICCAL